MQSSDRVTEKKRVFVFNFRNRKHWASPLKCLKILAKGNGLILPMCPTTLTKTCVVTILEPVRFMTIENLNSHSPIRSANFSHIRDFRINQHNTWRFTAINQGCQPFVTLRDARGRSLCLRTVSMAVVLTTPSRLNRNCATNNRASMLTTLARAEIQRTIRISV
jgi:hypothetical protein